MTTITIEADGQKCTIERDEDGMTACGLIECLVIPAMLGNGYALKSIEDAICEVAHFVSED